ncbi:MAG: hypothetical protein ABIZ04_14400 [Opitutus sp.]
MILGFFGSAVCYCIMSLGLAWPLVARLSLNVEERIGASAALSVLGIFLLGWAIYVAGLPTSSLWVLPILTAVGLIATWRSWTAIFRDARGRALLAAQAIVSGWSVGLLALIVDYSGGKHVGDWFGHWQRALLFLFRWPPTGLFNGFDPLPSRPPLANVVVGAFMRLTQVDFAHYQLASTLLSSLAFLPAALLARRLVGSSSGNQLQKATPVISVLAVLFMVNPMFAQNATYAWTKLPTAFFVLTAVYFFLRSRDANAPACAAWLFGATLGAALITHYSAGPYAVILALTWVAAGPGGVPSSTWVKATTTAAISGAVVLAIWFAWAIAVFGVHGTFLSNTSVTDQATSIGAQLVVIGLNLRDTLVPSFFRPSALARFSQSSPWGWWRDNFFLVYQNNLPFAFGSMGLAGIVAVLSRRFGARSRLLWPWLVSLMLLIALAVGTHGGREDSGLAHISLQPLVLMGLAFLSAQWHRLSPLWRRILVAGSTVDVLLGIVLQFGTENHAFDRWFAPSRPWTATLASYSEFAQMNSQVKGDAGWVFFGNSFVGSYGLVAALLVALLLLAVMRTHRATPPQLA